MLHFGEMVTIKHAAQANKMLSLQERRYCTWQAGVQDGCCYDFYVKAKIRSFEQNTNHKLSPLTNLKVCFIFVDIPAE